MDATPPKKQSYDSTLQMLAVVSASVIQVGLILYLAFATLLSWNIDNRSLLTYIIAPIAVIGFGYNMFSWERRRDESPFGSPYTAVAFVAVEIVIATFLSGGLNSPLFLAIPLIVMGSCILGVRAFNIGAVTSALVFLLLEAQVYLQTKSFNLHPSNILYLLISIAMGYLIARSIDHYIETAHMASAITEQLNSTQLSERLMLAAIADPVIGINKKLEINIFNSSAEDITGFDGASANGLPIANVLKLHDGTGAELKKANNPFLKVLDDKKQLNANDFYLLGKDGSKQYFSIAIAPTYNVDNSISGAIAVLHDISEQKGLQRERNEFVSTASHEMRTPVAAIEGYLSMASNPNLATVDERAKNFLEKAHQSALHLGKLFQDLLSVTKIEDQRLKDNKQVFNMSDLVSQVVTEMDMIVKKKGLQFMSHVGGSGVAGEAVIAPMYQVNADPDRMREVLTNLIDNAVKYTPKGEVEVTLTGDKNEVKVSVRDTGMGISPDEKKHMFEKFYRINNTMTTNIGGTGLGLYIARSLVELYGGRIWVDSTPGQGSTFSFTLPIVKS